MALAYGVADDQIKAFQEAFKKKFGEDPDVYSAYYYEVTKLIAQIMRDSGTSSIAIKHGLDAMTGSTAYHGITGETAFDAKGEVRKNFYIYQVRNGQFVLIGPPV